MPLKPIEPGHFFRLDYAPSAGGAWQIVAELTCSRCGAFQAADSDPAPDRPRLAELAVRLFNTAGWRATQSGATLCPDCARSKS